MKIVGEMGTNCGVHAQHEVPRFLGAVRNGGRYSQFVSLEKTTDIDLVMGRSTELVVSVAAIETPLSSKIVIDSDHAKIVILWDGKIRFKSDGVDAVAAAT